MAFGTLYTLTATVTALPADGVADATDGRATAAAAGVDGVTPPPPPKNSRKQNSAL